MVQMLKPQAQGVVNPIDLFIERHISGDHRRAVPLIDTAYDVVFEAGLAVIEARRVFRNNEMSSIEAVLTFPMPVHAVVFDLEAKIGTRVLRAKAQRNQVARASYEKGIDEGKASVLHEELLPGIHMLSVGQVGAGATIEVISRFAMAATHAGDRSTLRIPLTVGDVYGHSNLSDVDDLVHTPSEAFARLKVSALGTTIALDGQPMVDGEARVSLARPIDLAFSGWAARELEGRAADGRRVRLSIAPSTATAAPLDITIAVDHSGSMGERCAMGATDITKHQAVVATLNKLAGQLGKGDHVDLWEFDTVVNRIGSTRDQYNDRLESSDRVSYLISRLSDPSGGTEIGTALATISAKSTAQNILLLTDGKSHTLDVQMLARTGRRFTIVLVGEDSLEANVGHLAALTGGEIFVASGSDLAEALTQAIQSVRRPHEPILPAGEIIDRVSTIRAGMQITAAWAGQTTGAAAKAPLFSHAVAAIAARLLMPSLPEERAAALAEAEGLVSHLTSLVLIDEAGARQNTLPVTRKIPLATPATAAMYALSAPMPRSRLRLRALVADFDAAEFSRAASDFSLITPVPSNEKAAASRDRFDELAAKIDWSNASAQLANGQLTILPADIVNEIQAFAQQPHIVQRAAELGLDPIKLVIALIACRVWARNRAAARVLRAIKGDRAISEISV
jgi:Vault protein inter-alpha-trypsin domain/von Willebrand factor type A domain